jgi:hypothetical protein
LTPSSTATFWRLAGWLGAVLLALVVALALPALAMADEGDGGATTVAEQQAAAPAVTDEALPATDQPVAGAPAPAAEPAPAPAPAADAPVPVAEQLPPPEAPPVVAPAPVEPPAATSPPPAPDPVPVPQAAEPAPTRPPAPPVVDEAPPAVIPPVTIPDFPPLGDSGPVLAPELPELVPTAIPSPGLPPSVVVLAPAEPPRGAVLPIPTGPIGPLAPASSAAAALGVPTDDPSSVTLDLSGADPVAASAGAGTTPPAGAGVGPMSLQQDLITLDPDRAARALIAGTVTPPSTRPDTALGESAESMALAEHLVAPAGSPQSGSSLLAVLAGYVLPGSGAPPASTIMMLVLLGLVMAAIYAPRPQGSERLYLSGLLGPRAGHGMAVRRPG